MNTRAAEFLFISHFASHVTTPLHWRPRARAAAIHGAASLGVAVLAAALVFELWYPWPYRVISGGTELFLLLTSIDVVMGPLLTFTVFNPDKPRQALRRDLAVVVALQMAALGYGLHTVFLARPVVLALEDDRFRVVAAADVQHDELPRAPHGLRTLSLTGPRLISTTVPSDGKEKYDAIMLGLSGVDIGMRPSFWRLWDETARRDALAKSKPMAELIERRPDQRASAAADAALNGRAVAQVRYLPMLARRSDWVVLIDATSADVIGFAPLDGF